MHGSVLDITGYNGYLEAQFIQRMKRNKNPANS